MSRFSSLPQLSGVVVQGKQRGRTIGFPTLNIYGSFDTSSGTYTMRVLIDGQFFSGIGVRLQDQGLCEVHCFGMTGDWYGSTATVMILQHIRENKKFDTPHQLKQQLETDKARALAHRQTVLTFGSFDLIHPGHAVYLSFAKQHGDHLVTIVASDESIKRFKHHAPTLTQLERITHLQQLGVTDQVVAGDPYDLFKTVQSINPNVIVFGYDQDTQGVEYWYDQQKESKTPLFVRAPSYQPERYKSSLIKKSPQEPL